jgi:acyl carrier protein
VDTSSLEPDVPLTEQGLDSLDLMTVFLEIEETYHIKVPDQDYERLRTADEIAAYLNEQLSL